MHGVVWEIFSRSPAAKSVGAEEEVFTDHLHMHNDSLTSCPISLVELVFPCFPFGSRVVTHRCCSQFFAVSFECCDRFMAQGIRDYHLIMVAEHPILEPCVRNCCGCNHAAVSLTQQQYQQLIDRISRLEARMATLQTHAEAHQEQI